MTRTMCKKCRRPLAADIPAAPGACGTDAARRMFVGGGSLDEFRKAEIECLNEALQSPLALAWAVLCLEESDRYDLMNSDDAAEFCGAAKDVLLGFGVEWSEEAQDYILPAREPTP